MVAVVVGVAGVVGVAVVVWVGVGVAVAVGVGVGVWVAGVVVVAVVVGVGVGVAGVVAVGVVVGVGVGVAVAVAMTPDEAIDLLDRCYHSPAVNVVRAEVERLRQDLAAALADAETWHNTAAGSGLRVIQLRNDLAAARALLKEAQWWLRNTQCDGMDERIDSALAGEKNNGT